MKNLSLGCIALLLTFGATAQVPDPDQICTDNIESTWDATTLPVPQDARTGLPFNWCDSIYAPQGKFKYISGDFPEPIPNSWTDDDVYGLVGNGTWYGAANGNYMEAALLETRITAIEGTMQYYDNPVLTIQTGNWRFDRIYIGGNTTLHVKSGARVEITTALHLNNNGKLIIDEGADVVLKHTTNGQAVIQSDFGVIEGRITKQLYLSFDDYDNTDQTDGDVQRFVVATGLYDIDVDAMIRQIQDTLTELTVKPTVQVGWWVEQEEIPQYSYVASHSYHNNVSSSASPANINQGSFVRDYSNLIVLGPDNYYNPAIVYNQYDVNHGAAITPVYGTGSNTLTDLLANTQLNSIQGQQTSATAEELGLISRMPESWKYPMVINMQNANDAKTSMVLEVTGRWKHEATYTMSNDAYDETEYTTDISTFFQLAAEINTTVETMYLGDLYSYNAATAVDAYRNLDFTGLNFIHNGDGTQIDMQKLNDKLKEAAPHAARTYYDIKPLITFMPERIFATDAASTRSYNTLAGRSHLQTVAAYLDFYDHDDNEWKTVDIYNIEGIEHPKRIGDTLETNDVIGWNYTNHYFNPEYDGNSFVVYPDLIQPNYDYSNMGGPLNTVTEDTVVWADTPIKRAYDIESDIYDLNKMQLTDYKGGTNVDNYPCSGSFNCEKNRGAIDAMDEFTLLRLAARTSTNEVIPIAYLPFAFGPQYDANQIDPFEYSIAPNPAMYLLRQENGRVGSLREGAHARGTTNSVDTLYLVVDFDAFQFELDGVTISEYFIDSPIGQHPNAYYSAWWHVLARNGNSGSWQQMDQPTFEIPVTNTSVTIDRANGVAGTETFNGDVITLITSPLYGDFNHDFQVTTTDLLTLMGMFGLAVTDNTQYLDFDNNGIIGAQDLIAVLNYFGDGFPDNMYGGQGYQSPLQERIIYLSDKKDNNHISYDWREYPGFTPQQRAYLSTCKVRGTFAITDEFETIIHSGPIVDDADNNILLPSNAPTTSQLLNSNTGTSGTTSIGYQIHIFSDYYLDIPGLTAPVRYLCLGSNDVGAPFATPPVFTGY